MPTRFSKKRATQRGSVPPYKPQRSAASAALRLRRDMSACAAQLTGFMATTSAIGVLVVLCSFYCLFHYVHRRWRWRRSHAMTAVGDTKDVLAIFCNPRVPRALQLSRGLQPLALGQELKHLLRSLPLSTVAIEPAATLVDAQEALKRHQPRILAFAGHTFGGRLAFEDERGRLDVNADPEHFVNMVTGLTLPQASPALPSKPSWLFGKPLPKGRQPGELAGWRPLMDSREHEKKHLHAHSLKTAHAFVRNLRSREEAIEHLRRMTKRDQLDRALGLGPSVAGRLEETTASPSNESSPVSLSPISAPRGHRRTWSGSVQLPRSRARAEQRSSCCHLPSSSPSVLVEAAEAALAGQPSGGSGREGVGVPIQAAVDDLQIELRSHGASEWKQLASWGGLRRKHAQRGSERHGAPPPKPLTPKPLEDSFHRKPLRRLESVFLCGWRSAPRRAPPRPAPRAPVPRRESRRKPRDFAPTHPPPTRDSTTLSTLPRP
jgi:hypothetical protein